MQNGAKKFLLEISFKMHYVLIYQWQISRKIHKTFLAMTQGGLEIVLLLWRVP